MKPIDLPLVKDALARIDSAMNRTNATELKRRLSIDDLIAHVIHCQDTRKTSNCNCFTTSSKGITQ